MTNSSTPGVEFLVANFCCASSLLVELSGNAHARSRPKVQHWALNFWSLTLCAFFHTDWDFLCQNNNSLRSQAQHGVSRLRSLSRQRSCSVSRIFRVLGAARRENLRGKNGTTSEQPRVRHRVTNFWPLTFLRHSSASGADQGPRAFLRPKVQHPMLNFWSLTFVVPVQKFSTNRAPKS